MTARSELTGIKLSVPWVSSLMSEHADELHRDETALRWDDLEAIAARLDDVGPSTETAVMMLVTEPDLITGP
ncbi:hypothetical protein ACFFSW_07555 [Saccharothrix longispora]|uniref:Uncharacterized protein n=1 Tax=Saccharothrix longispora TaxID=33920 RepID=A0ABU1PMA6_9PSEU|nr:hypothetical protein [Saccharothrix longispora]MDR6591790.1 hypothetical protein [Saccharothrix longispora]